MLTTPDTIRTLQRKLYAKAKQEPAYRFYALYDKLYREDILSHAWRLVRSNRGSPGMDGISFEAIESGIGVETFLRDLARDLKDKTYRAQPVRRVMIPKADGSQRPLGIPTLLSLIHISSRSAPAPTPARRYACWRANSASISPGSRPADRKAASSRKTSPPTSRGS